MPNELLRCCSSLSSLFFRIIGVSDSGRGTIESILELALASPSNSRPMPIARIDFLVFLTKALGGAISPLTPSSMTFDEEAKLLGGDDGRGADAMLGPDDWGILSGGSESCRRFDEVPVLAADWSREGETVVARSRTIRVESLFLAIFRSEGGGGRSNEPSISSSGGVSEELRLMGWGLNVAAMEAGMSVRIRHRDVDCRAECRCLGIQMKGVTTYIASIRVRL